MVCPICNYEGTKIEIKEDMEDSNKMVKFISCSQCGRLLEKTNMENGRILMKVKQVKFYGKTETVLTGSKEPAFIARARNTYRPERKLWEFK